MLKKGDRVLVKDAVVAHYFGDEELEVFAVTPEWITFETIESDLPSFVGQHEEFRHAEVENCFNAGLFVMKTDS